MLGDTKNTHLRTSQKLPRLTIQQQLDNQDVVERMNRKIAFTKNPRHLTQPLPFATALSGTAVTSLAPPFTFDPTCLYFTDYEQNHIYESSIRLTNATRHIQRIKVAPLKNACFLLSAIKYPKEETGDIAPGMSVTVSIRFRPTSLNDFEQQLTVIVAQGVIKVPLLARRQKSEIGWPKNIDCGHCWVGNVIKKEVVIKNMGGEATFNLVQPPQGYFTVSPNTLTFMKNNAQNILVTFRPEQKGNHSEKISFKSSQGEQEQIDIQLTGGAYSAQVVLDQINKEKVVEQKIDNSLYLRGCELNQEVSEAIKIKNLAVVKVDYFWHIEANTSLKISNQKGQLQPSQVAQFIFSYAPTSLNPSNIRAQLYLFNLPQKSLVNNSITKMVNGVLAIQCMGIEVDVKVALSTMEVFPLHRQTTQPLYEGIPVQETLTIRNNTKTKRTFRIQLVTATPDFACECLQSIGSVEGGQLKTIIFSLSINKLSTDGKLAYFVVNFDNAPSEMVSFGGKSTYPCVMAPGELYYGLVRTYTRHSSLLPIQNTQRSPVYLRFHNPYRFYSLQFYDFYQFETEQFYKPHFNIYIDGREVVDWIAIPPNSLLQFQCIYNAQAEESINFDIEIEVRNGVSQKIALLGEVHDVSVLLSRDAINMREIYKGNVYNSNKFLSKELSITNNGHLDASFEIMVPQADHCLIKIEPNKGIIKKNSAIRLDIILEPIKTGGFTTVLKWCYFDSIKQDSSVFNRQDGQKSFLKERQLTITGMVRGMEVNYYIKDEAKAKKIRQKVEEPSQSVKFSASSFRSSSKTEMEKLIYPTLEELVFYNCEINTVRQMEILIQNDSGLSTQFTICSEKYASEYKETPKTQRSQLIGAEEEVFNSEMGRQHMKNKVLQNSQKIHLGNNKGIAILCEPSSGVISKKQTQRILITMFNDRSGKFSDNLIIEVKDHERRKFRMEMHVIGTPVSLSRNQLGIDFARPVPLMHVGTLLTGNGATRKQIKIVNNGSNNVTLQWGIYPHNQNDPKKDLFTLEFAFAHPSSNQIMDIAYNAVKPDPDKHSSFSIHPAQKTLKGKEECVFTLNINQLQKVGHYSNILVCEPVLVDQDSNGGQLDALAVVIQAEAVSPLLTMDAKHGQHINKLQKFAVAHIEQQTNSQNHRRKIVLKNALRTNVSFCLSTDSTNFKIVNTSTNSPVSLALSSTKQQTSFVLAYDTIVETTIQLCADATNLIEWPMQEKVRKDANLLVSYSNGSTQTFPLVGWLYRPWIQLIMPNGLPYSPQNDVIDVGVVHVKNSKKVSIQLVNKSKVDAKWSLNYLKYHQSIKYKFEQTLWTKQDYEDQTILDKKEAFRLSEDGGVVRNSSIPIHYMPSTLALTCFDDRFATDHKPLEVSFLFKPDSNALYKSKFRLAVSEGIQVDVILKGRGTFEEEKQIK